MRPSAYLIPLALLLTACPPKDEETETRDSGAAETTGAQGPVEPDPQTAKPGPAKPEPSMERGLVVPKKE